MIGLIIILFLVLILPFMLKIVEQNLEVFLFLMGLFAAFISGVFNRQLLLQALEDPIKITIAVVISGLLFKWFKIPIKNGIQKIIHFIPFPVFLFLTVVLLGLLSSVITAIIAALVLVLLISSMNLSRQAMVLYAVISCFAIGLGAALTPIGEPLSTITTSKLKQDFFYLFELIGQYVIPGVLLLGILAAILVKPSRMEHISESTDSDSYEDILVRGIKIYFFVMGLTLLGAGFEPLINKYLLNLNSLILYWVNIISAILDNATLAAAEISSEMSNSAIQAILLGLLISGGMLIPGNIPNIISAGKLNITSKEWARYGVPIGMALMVLYFIVLI